jgi:pyrroline-5-carboxylate reductase
MENGLSEEEARLIVQSLFVGIANNIEFDTNFKELIKQVASPGGTTEAGLNIMSKNKLSEIINEVILEASTRSKELREDNN